MDDAFAAGDQFMLNSARLLERRLFATCFLGAQAGGVVDALCGYQNDDGGFGQALEPDTRCPESLPVYVEAAFQALGTAGTADRQMMQRACDYLARVAAEAGAGGAVPLAFPIIESFPHAGHWTGWTYEPGLNPTAGLVGLLYQLGVEHAWRDQAAALLLGQTRDGRRARRSAHSLGILRLPRAHSRARPGSRMCGGLIPPFRRVSRAPS